jgi:N-acetylmuramoyl-L-alanine amidase
MLRTLRLAAAALAAAVLLPAAPAFGSIHTVAPGETLWGIALSHGLSAGAVAAANGLSPEARVVAGTNLTIPALGATTTAAPAAAPGAAGAGGGVRVRWGDTLSALAARNGVSLARLAAANGLDPDRPLLAGTTLRLPGPAASAVSTAATPSPSRSSAPASAAGSTAPSASGATGSGGGLRVRFGDTLSEIAARNGVSLARLAAANGLDPSKPLLAGTTLRLPAQGGVGASAAPATATSAAPAPIGAYKVRPGDTLSELATRSRVPVAQMAFMNGLDPRKPLLAGTILKLPTGSPVVATTPPPQRTIVPAAPPVATGGRLSAAQIGSIAAQHGVPSSLATAIAWQESGFNNGMLSDANARGIMQMLPGTWDWVQANLARARLNPSSPEDNVKAGSLYLAQLLRDTNGDPAMAAAAYYQGLSSVRRIGMLPETRRYVANVMALRARFGG